VTGWKIWARIPADQLWGPPKLLLNGHRCYLPGAKQQVPEVDRLPTSCAEVNNQWSSTSSPQICLRMWKDNNIWPSTWQTHWNPWPTLRCRTNFAIIHNLTYLAHITKLGSRVLKYNETDGNYIFPSILRTHPKVKRLTVPKWRETYGHTEYLIKLTSYLVCNRDNLNRVKPVPVRAMKAYVWRRGTAPLLLNHKIGQLLGSFTKDYTLPKVSKDCRQHSTLSTKKEQQPNPHTIPAVLKVQQHSYWDMTSRRTVWETHNNVRNSLNVSTSRNILHCYKVFKSTTSSLP
jgi:hypothetical protein